MKAAFNAWKKPFILALVATAIPFLLSIALVRCSGWILAPLLRDYSPVFRQLAQAKTGWHPLVPVGVFLLSALVLRFVKKRGWAAGVLVLFALAVGLVTMIVNEVPLVIALRSAACLLG